MTSDTTGYAGDYPREDGIGAGTRALAVSVAELVPALVFFYVLIIWPLVFGDATQTAAEATLGWLVAVNGPAEGIGKQIAYPLLFVVSSLCLAATTTYRRLPWGSAGFVLLVAIMAYALASTAWSAAPPNTVMRAVLFAIIALTLAFSVFTSRSIERVLAALFWVIFLVAVLNAGAIVLKPRGPIGHMGIYDHKNVFGWVAAVVLYFGLYGLATGSAWRRMAAAFMTAAAPVFLVAAESKTSLGLAFLCPILGTALWLGARHVRLSPAVAMAVAVVAAGFVFELGRASGAWDFASFNRTFFGNPTLTGRTEIWTFVLGLISKAPLIGYGYEAVFQTGIDGIVQRNAVGFVRGMPTAHNGYLDIWVQIGIVGLAATIVFLLIAFDAAGRLAQSDAALGWLAVTLVLFVSLHNCLESDVMVSSNPLSMLILLFFFVALRARELRSETLYRIKEHSINDAS